MNYTIKTGETLWSIALSKYNDQAMALVIADANGIRDMQRVAPGTVLRLP